MHDECVTSLNNMNHEQLGAHYDKIRPQLLEKYPGKWILLTPEKKIYACETETQANYWRNELGGTESIMRCVGNETPVHLMW